LRNGFKTPNVSRVTNHDSRITFSVPLRAAWAMPADFLFLAAEFGAWLRQFFAATMFELRDEIVQWKFVFHRVAPLVAE
jgi:hypothetical protein